MKKYRTWTRLPHDENGNYTGTNNMDYDNRQDAEDAGMLSGRDYVIEEFEEE